MKVILALLLLGASVYCAPTTTAKPEGSSEKPASDFKTFHDHTQTELHKLETNVAKVEKEEVKHLSNEQLTKLKAQLEKDIEEVNKLEKSVEAESKKTLTEEQKAFVTKSADTLKDLKKRLTAAQEKLGHVATGTTKAAASTTAAIFEAENVTTTEKPASDFKTFHDHTQTELHKLETNVAKVEKEEVKHLNNEQLTKLKAQVEKDIEEVDKLEKRVEAESKKTLTEEQKAFVTKSADTLKDLKKRLTAAQEKLGHVATGTTKAAPSTTAAATTAAATTKAFDIFEAENVTTTEKPVSDFKTFHDHTQTELHKLETNVAKVEKEEVKHLSEEHLSKLKAQVEKDIEEVDKLEKRVEAESKKTLTEEQKAFVTKSADTLKDLKKRLTAAQEKLGHVAATTKAPASTAAATTAAATTKAAAY